MGANDDFFQSIQYTTDAAGEAARERNEAIRQLDNLQDSGADAAAVQAQAKKVDAATLKFSRVTTAPPVAKLPATPAGVTSTAKPDVYSYTPEQGVPKVTIPSLTSHIVAVPTGEPISTAVLTVIATVFSIVGFGSSSAIKRAVEAIRTALKDLANILANMIWTFAHNIRWVLSALRWLWERVLRPLISHIDVITKRVVAIIDRVLKPYLQMLEHLRQQILAIYKKFFLPVIEAIQKIRTLLALLKILRVPGVKALDEKLAKIEGKLIGVITGLLRRTNDHSGLLNILLNTRMTLQHGVLMTSLVEIHGAWINNWWNAQTVQRNSADAEAQVRAELEIQGAPRQKELGEFLRTRVYATTHSPGPEEQRLDALLRRGAA